MALHLPVPRPPETVDAFLLGVVDFSSALALQQLFARELLSSSRHRGCLLLCEHPPCVTRGTERLDDQTLAETGTSLLERSLSVPRPGGLLEHGPTQLAIYPVFSLARMELTPLGYRDCLEAVVARACREQGVPEVTILPGVGVSSRGGLVARTAIHVSDEVTQLGMYLNVSVPYSLHTRLRCSSLDVACMKRTDLARLKTDVVHQFASCLGSTRVAIYTRHPMLRRTGKPRRDEKQA